VACFEVLVAENTYEEGECAVVRQGHLIAIARAFLIVCAVLVVVGCAGLRSGVPQEEQGHTEVTNEQGRSPEATASEEPRCGETRTFVRYGESWVTNDVPGCPNKGGLLSGTDKPDKLLGEDGDDEVRGLGANDSLEGGSGSDVLHGGDGTDSMYGANGEDVLYGGDGNDTLDGRDEGHWLKDAQRDELYCGEGRDYYLAGELDYVSRSCEVKYRPQGRS
jgi:Ca2+-binding RTX toxin-like protein